MTTALTELPTNVILGVSVFGILEDLPRIPKLD
jgi:hypothetical protein